MIPNQPPAARPSISFIVLALNEEENLRMTVETILRAVTQSQPGDYQIVLVNDGSTDQTGEIMEQLAKANSKIAVVHNQKNLGLGGAYKRGITFAHRDYVMIVAGDNVMPSSDMSLILDRLGEADIVLPYLTNPNLRPLGRRVGSWAFTQMVNLWFGFRVRYYQGMLPRREMLTKICITTDSYAFPAEVVVKLLKGGCSYVEVGIDNTPSHRAPSRALQPQRLLGVLKAVVNLAREVRRPGAVPSARELGIPVRSNKEVTAISGRGYSQP
jgi:glycosyltransferase involved in cell wall biosynthesis